MAKKSNLNYLPFLKQAFKNKVRFVKIEDETVIGQIGKVNFIKSK